MRAQVARRPLAVTVSVTVALESTFRLRSFADHPNP